MERSSGDQRDAIRLSRRLFEFYVGLCIATISSSFVIQRNETYRELAVRVPCLFSLLFFSIFFSFARSKARRRLKFDSFSPASSILLVYRRISRIEGNRGKERRFRSTFPRACFDQPDLQDWTNEIELVTSRLLKAAHRVD